MIKEVPRTAGARLKVSEAAPKRGEDDHRQREPRQEQADASAVPGSAVRNNGRDRSSVYMARLLSSTVATAGVNPRAPQQRKVQHGIRGTPRVSD